VNFLQLYTNFKAIRRPGKSGPAVFAFSDPRPPLRDFTQNIDARAKPSLHKPIAGLTSRGFGKTDVFGASPVASALDQRTGRDPSASGFTLSCRVTKLLAADRIFFQVESSFLPNANPQQYNNTGTPEWMQKDPNQGML